MLLFIILQSTISTTFKTRDKNSFKIEEIKLKILIVLVIFPCLQTNHMNIFSSSDILNSYCMTLTRGHSFERNKKSPSFRTNDDTIIVCCFAFLYFPAINNKFSLFISRDLFSRDLLSFLCFYFLCYIKVELSPYKKIFLLASMIAL